MKGLFILILAMTLVSCQTYKEKFVSMHHNKENDQDCFWLQSIVSKKGILGKSEKLHLHYCCPNKDVNNKKIRPVCVYSRFMIYK